MKLYDFVVKVVGNQYSLSFNTMFALFLVYNCMFNHWPDGIPNLYMSALALILGDIAILICKKMDLDNEKQMDDLEKGLDNIQKQLDKLLKR